MLTSNIVEFQGQKVADLRSILLNRNFAIVDIEALDRLVEALNSVSLTTIKEQLIDKIKDCYTTESLISTLESEVAFRRTITGVKQIDLQDLMKPVEKPVEKKAASSVSS